MQSSSIMKRLDEATASLVMETVDCLVQQLPELQAIILYGSVARGKERSLSDPHPSDVDLLAIFDCDEPLLLPLRDAIFHAIGDAHRRHLHAPRDVNVMLATRSMQEWDTLFLENVARDGIVLFAHGPLPLPIASLAALLSNG